MDKTTATGGERPLIYGRRTGWEEDEITYDDTHRTVCREWAAAVLPRAGDERKGYAGAPGSSRRAYACGGGAGVERREGCHVFAEIGVKQFRRARPSTRRYFVAAAATHQWKSGIDSRPRGVDTRTMWRGAAAAGSY